MRRFVLVVLAISLVAAITGVGHAQAGSFTKRGTVTGITDGDTITVRLQDGTSEKVRLLGIDTPERGACQSAQATARTRELAMGERVTLKGDRTQDTRDRYRRLLAYVWLPGGKDLGFQLLAGGNAKVYVYDGAFERLAAYRRAEAAGKGSGVWACGGATGPTGTTPKPKPKPGRGNCDPSYPDVCIPPYDQVGDLDCADVPYTDIRVVGSDPHGFDGRDNDGWGCEG